MLLRGCTSLMLVFSSRTFKLCRMEIEANKYMNTLQNNQHIVKVYYIPCDFMALVTLEARSGQHHGWHSIFRAFILSSVQQRIVMTFHGQMNPNKDASASTNPRKRLRSWFSGKRKHRSHRRHSLHAQHHHHPTSPILIKHK